MIGPIGRGVLDPPPARRMTAGVRHYLSVIASAAPYPGFGGFSFKNRSTSGSTE
jgi:hypothetical protein